MDPEVVKQLLLGVVPPFLLGAVVFGVMWWKKQADVLDGRGGAAGSGGAGARRFLTGAFRRGAGAGAWWRDAVMVLCAAGAFLGVYPLVFGKFHAWPGASADGALWWCAIVALAAGLAWCGVRNAWARGGSVVLALGVCAWLSFRRQLFDSWGAGESIATIAMLVVGGGVFALALARLGERGRVAGVIGSIAAVGMAAQVLVVCLASLKHAQGAGAFAAFLTFAMVMVLLRPARAMSGAMLAMIGIVVATQLVQLVRFGDGKWPWLMAGLAMSGPVLGLVAMRFFSRGGVASVLVPIVATALPAATAVGMGAFFSMQAEKANGSTSDYEY